jgi:hypothetical protein
MRALLKARAGDAVGAADIFEKLSADPLAPEDIRARAVTLRALYLGAVPVQEVK